MHNEVLLLSDKGGFAIAEIEEFGVGRKVKRIRGLKRKNRVVCGSRTSHGRNSRRISARHGINGKL
jgi:hypothetical protein